MHFISHVSFFFFLLRLQKEDDICIEPSTAYHASLEQDMTASWHDAVKSQSAKIGSCRHIMNRMYLTKDREDVLGWSSKAAWLLQI